MDFKVAGWESGVDGSGSGQEQVASSPEHDDEFWLPQNEGNFLSS